MVTKKQAAEKEVAEKKSPPKKVSLTAALAKKTAVKKPVVKKPAEAKEEVKTVKRKPRKPAPTIVIDEPVVITPKVTKVPLVPVQDGNTLAVNSLMATLDLTVQTAQGEMKVKSGFLMPDRSLDLMALSMNGEWLRTGLIKEDDKLSPEINLKALAVNINGEDKMVLLRPEEHQFVTPENSSSDLKELKTTIIYKADGKRTIIMIEATIGLTSGRIFLKAITPEWLTVKGYMLEAHRLVKG